MLKALTQITSDIYHTNYPAARIIFLAGSVVRRESTSNFVLSEGSPKWNEPDIDTSRYATTDLVDDSSGGRLERPALKLEI